MIIVAVFGALGALPRVCVPGDLCEDRQVFLVLVEGYKIRRIYMLFNLFLVDSLEGATTICESKTEI